MRYLLLIVFLCGCSTTAYRKGDCMILKGYGAASASWESEGEKYSISRVEPVKMPDLIPTR